MLWRFEVLLLKVLEARSIWHSIVTKASQQRRLPPNNACSDLLLKRSQGHQEIITVTDVSIATGKSITPFILYG